MTSVTVCSLCGGQVTLHECPEDGTLRGRCPGCRHYIIETMRGATAPEEDDPTAHTPVEWEKDTGRTFLPRSTIKIREAGFQAEAIDGFIQDLEATCGVRWVFRDLEKDQVYIMIMGHLAEHDYTRMLGRHGILHDIIASYNSETWRRLVS